MRRVEYRITINLTDERAIDYTEKWFKEVYDPPVPSYRKSYLRRLKDYLLTLAMRYKMNVRDIYFEARKHSSLEFKCWPCAFGRNDDDSAQVTLLVYGLVAGR